VLLRGGNDVDNEATVTRTYAYQVRRLASPSPVEHSDIPSWSDLGIDSAAEEAREWYGFRDSLAFQEVASTWLSHQTDRWTELAGLAGSIGEVLSLACAAEVEAALLERGIISGALPEQEGLGRRAFGEMEGYFVMSAAHKLTNWCARAGMLATGYPWGWEGSPKRLRQRLPVFSENPRQWCRAEDGKVVGEILHRSGDAALQAAADALISFLTSPEWIALTSQRGEDFHRWRYESPYVTAVSKSSRWVNDPGSRTRTIALGLPAYTVASAIVDEVCRLSHAAALGMAKALSGVREGFDRARPFLTAAVVAVDPPP
jgi:hypothetical protein